MTQREPEFGAELDAAEVAPLLGLAFEDLDPALPPQVVSTGAPFAIVALQKRRSVGAAQSESGCGHGVAARARSEVVLRPGAGSGRSKTKRDGTKYRARMQFYGGEDPATGSAAGCAISYLVARGAVPSGTRVHVRQGVEIGRPSDLFLSAKTVVSRVTDVRVAGSTVLVAKGQLFLP